MTVYAKFSFHNELLTGIKLSKIRFVLEDYKLFVLPPSTGTLIPLIYDAASEAKKLQEQMAPYIAAL